MRCSLEEKFNSHKSSQSAAVSTTLQLRLRLLLFDSAALPTRSASYVIPTAASKWGTFLRFTGKIRVDFRAALRGYLWSHALLLQVYFSI